MQEKETLQEGDIFEFERKKWRVKSTNGFMLTAENINPEDPLASLQWIGSIDKRNYKLVERK
ncbi:hypothetical protein [Anaerorhabdus sp.]|uniref:hypothetical protein n=1 Tax=Anaerorhabdus sp. TaxID=1872524 RepID=UPI002FC8EA3A